VNTLVNRTPATDDCRRSAGPTGEPPLDPAVIKLIDALARTHAKEDHEGRGRRPRFHARTSQMIVQELIELLQSEDPDGATTPASHVHRVFRVFVKPKPLSAPSPERHADSVPAVIIE
jgi:hypothetical protein